MDFAKIILLLFLSQNIASVIYAQVPQGIPYQAVARNGQGQPLASTNVKVRFSILDSTATGTAVYVESHSTTTSALGLFSANVGMGTATTGTFSSINWGQNYKFLKVELDTTATGNGYIDLGTQQMMSVPYALYAGNVNAGNSSSGNTINDSSITLFSGATIGNGTYQVPQGEYWKVVSLRKKIDFGTIPVTANYSGSCYSFTPSTLACYYSFPTVTLFRINSDAYNAYWNTTALAITIATNTPWDCSICPAQKTFTNYLGDLPGVTMPIWLSFGDEIQIGNSILCSIEKYK